MGSTPKVTVFIPVYNRATYIAAAIDSILAQRFRDFELLLLDDGSTDGSVAVMRSYTADPRVRLVCNEEHHGIPQTRNQGRSLARGQYLAMLDSDDIAHPARLGKQVAFLDRHPDYALIGTWTGGMDENGRLLRKLRLPPVSPAEVHVQLLFQCCPTQSSVMARTDLLRAYRYREEYKVSSDFDLWVRLARQYKLGNLPYVLVRCRRHGRQVTRERAQLVKETCLGIMGPQLTALGMTFTPTDLERHFFLLRMRKLQFTPDQEYLTWANGWLQRLQVANAQSRRYPSQSFARLLGQIWFLVCRRAAGKIGWTAWRAFSQSPLRQELWSSVRLVLLLQLLRRLAPAT